MRIVMRKFTQSLALAALLLSTSAYAQNVAPAASVAAKAAKVPWLYEGSDVPVDDTWTFGVLPNGLRYAVKKNDVPAGQVSIRVRIDAGALHENNDEQGFAHLIEHLSFRGSTFVPDGEAKRIWQRFGVTFGSDSNAQTTPTQTVYKLDLPNATPEKLDESVKIISGMIRNPRISPSALNAERAIVLAELRENSGAQMVYSDALRQHAFQGQRLANRSTIGTPETLQASDAIRLSAFHDRWYRPENAVVVMAGDMEPAQLANLVQKYFNDWKGSGPRASEPAFGDPTPQGTPTRVLIEPTLPATVSIAYLRPWRKVDDTIAYNEQLLIDALALQIINRRLEVQARSGGNYLFAEIAQEDISRTADATLVSVTPVGDKWEAATRDVRAVIADAVATPPSVADIEREKTLFGNALRTMLDSYPFEAAAKQADDIVNAVDIRETVAAPKTVVQVYEGMKDKFTPPRGQRQILWRAHGRVNAPRRHVAWGSSVFLHLARGSVQQTKKVIRGAAPSSDTAPMNTYLITYDLVTPGQNYTNLFTAIRGLGSSCKPLLSTWIVRSNLTTVQIRDTLGQYVDANDKIFVAFIGNNWASSNLTVADVNWLKSVE